MARLLPPEFSYQHKKIFFTQLKHYYWEEPIMYKHCANQVIRRCVPYLCGQYRLPRRWENELLWVISCKGNSLCFITKRIAWGASIYHLWRQRNARVHENQYIYVDSIFYLICNDVRLRIASFQNVADNPANRDLCERWCLPHTIFRTTRGD